VNLDRGAPKGQSFGWDAKAEVATSIADDHWNIEIRIPVTQDENDPLHQVIGRKPTQSLPWHINLYRQRVRVDGSEFSALSPTGTDGFDEPLKFAHFYDGRTHPFEVDPTVSDFVIALREAAKLRQPAESLPVYLALAEGEFTDYQKSVALEQAVSAATALKNYAQADALAVRIPIPAVQKTAQMQILLARAKAVHVVAQFANEDIAQWPFWKRGDGYLVRGNAHLITKNSKQAESDLTHALEWLSDDRARKSAEQSLRSLQATK
jgi:hypothetical protein